MITLRQKLHTIMDDIPDRSLSVLEPLLTHLANEADYWEPITEPASPEEEAMIEEGFREFEKDPSSFVTFYPGKYTE